MNDIGIRYNSSHFTPCQTNNADQTLSSSTGVKSTPHASRKLPLTEKSPPFIDGLVSKTITTVSSGITITDSKQTMDANDAWEEIESLLQKHIGLSSSHLAKAKQCLNELSATKFQYFEDLADAVITRLNTTEGTNYSLTGEIKTNDHNKSVGKLWEVCKYLTTAFAAQSLRGSLLFEHGDKSNGPVGLRLKSGNGDYTYWVEYRTTGAEANNTSQGVLINLDGYAHVGKRARE